MPIEKSAGAVIFRKNKKIYYLLLHYQTGHWGFSKGNIEKGEKIEETVKREIKEETEIEDIKFVNGFKEWIKYFYQKTYGLEKEEKKKTPWTFKIVTFYLAETRTAEIKLSFEHKDYAWLEYKDAFEKLTFKNAKEILKKANDYLMKHET